MDALKHARLDFCKRRPGVIAWLLEHNEGERE